MTVLDIFTIISKVILISSLFYAFIILMKWNRETKKEIKELEEKLKKDN